MRNSVPLMVLLLALPCESARATDCSEPYQHVCFCQGAAFAQVAFGHLKLTDQGTRFFVEETVPSDLAEPIWEVGDQVDIGPESPLERELAIATLAGYSPEGYVWRAVVDDDATIKGDPPYCDGGIDSRELAELLTVRSAECRSVVMRHFDIPEPTRCPSYCSNAGVSWHISLGALVLLVWLRRRNQCDNRL